MCIEFLPYWLSVVCYCCALVIAFVTYIRCLPLHLTSFPYRTIHYLTAFASGLPHYPFLSPPSLWDPSLLPDGVVGSTEVDEKIPAPVPHGKQVSHAAKIHGQQTGTTPDGGHAPGCHPHIRILGSQGVHLPVQVVRALEKGRDHTLINIVSDANRLNFTS